MRAGKMLWCSALGVGVLAAAVQASPVTSAFGAAGNYNVFVFGNMTTSQTDAQGAVAVGGNATFDNYTTGSQLSSGSTSLVVGGNLTKNTYGSTYNGNVVVGGNATLTNPTVYGSLSANGNVTINPNGGGTVSTSIKYGGNYSAPNYAPFTTSGFATHGPVSVGLDFPGLQKSLTASSGYWSSIPSNASTTVFYNNLILTGTDSTRNVFTVHGSDLASASSLSINVPAGSTALINIDGTSDRMQNFGMSLLNGTSENTLFNFYQATSLYITGTSVEGSVLAPLANVNFAGGSMDGTLIANNDTGQGESHLHLFTGNLPTAPVFGVPEPASLAFFGGAMLLLIKRPRRKRCLIE